MAQTPRQELAPVAPSEAATHRIGSVVSRTGLSAHAIRAWERRYGAVRPARTEGGSRLYSDADIARLLLLKALRDRGHALDQLAARSDRELAALLRPEALLRRQGPETSQRPVRSQPPETPRHPDASVRPDGGPNAADLAQVTMAVLDALDCFDLDAAERCIQQTADRIDVHRLLHEVITPLLQETGRRWAIGAVRIAQEHATTQVVRRVLDRILRQQPISLGAPAAVSATLEGQSHELPALMAAILAATEGYRPVYLGPELPPAELVHAAGQVDARVLILSFGVEEPGVDETVRRLAAALPTSVTMVLGGRGAPVVRSPRVEVLPTLHDLAATLARLAP